MADLVLSGNTSGTVTISVPAVAGTNTATVPAQTGTLQMIGVGTAVNSTSGTAIDFTGIPSWVKRITLMLSGVSTSGSVSLLLQVGTSSGVQTSGYAGGLSSGNSAIVTSALSSGFLVSNNNASTSVNHVVATFVNISGNTWMMNAIGQKSDTTGYGFTAGSVTLSAALDRIRTTTANGTDTFDAGTINILYEG